MNTPLLDENAKLELEKRFRSDRSHAVRMRCQLILLKADGIPGLLTKPGRGRKPVIFSEQEQQKAIELIKDNRQKLHTAKAEWESQQGKSIG